MYGWGDNSVYQLGHRTLGRRRLPPLVPTLIGSPKGKIASIHAAASHAFAIDKTGNVWAWGANNYGQTGHAKGAGEGFACIYPPKKVRSLGQGRIKSINGGNFHSVAITHDGECLTWGRIDDGRTGVDTETLSLDDPEVLTQRNRPSILLRPTPVSLPANCFYAAAGAHHSLAVTTDGKAYSWGLNSDGECGLGPNAEDEILVPTLIAAKSVRDKPICWAGGGGQGSMLAISAAAQNGASPAVNGVFRPKKDHASMTCSGGSLAIHITPPN